MRRVLRAAAVLALTGLPGLGWPAPPARAGAPAVLPPLTPAQLVIRDGLRAHVERLASTIGERNTSTPEALERAAAYVEERLRALGDTVTSLPYESGGRTVRNLEVERRGTERPLEIVVVGAHYDSAPGTPGADDNASGVAALLELARLLQGRAHPRTVRFVAFVNEEPPWFQTDGMGSLVYARRCQKRGDKVVGMLALETVGYYSTAPGSQHYPPPLDLLYPDTGDFIGVVGDVRSLPLVQQVSDALRAQATVPPQPAALPDAVPGVGWSDHWSFWQAGYPAVMVTDTAPNRNPNYHRKGDTAGTLDYDRLARVVAGLERAVTGLAAAR